MSEHYKNLGVDGASVSTIRGENTVYNQVIRNRIPSVHYVLLEGGVNDAWDVCPVGTMVEASPEETDISALDLSTFAGGLEQLLYQVKKQYPNAKIGYIICFKLDHPAGKLKDMSEYVEMTKKICDKWGVPYLDLHGNDELTAKLHPKKANGQYDSTYVHDFVHPSALGYDILYPYVEEFLIDLVTPDPEPEPEVTEPVETPVETPVTEKTEKEKEGGCKGFTASLGATVAVISLAAVAVLSKKKK
jgi:lysophospholipase L1-like esterase